MEKCFHCLSKIDLHFNDLFLYLQIQKILIENLNVYYGLIVGRGFKAVTKNKFRSGPCFFNTGNFY